LYGVYEYLNRLGVQFIGLGDIGTVLPDKKAELISDISIVENPAFLTRGYCTKKREQAHDKFFIWMGRNRMNLWAAGQDNKLHLLKKLGIQLADGFHDIQLDYINPQNKYPYNHPQFYGDENKPADPYKISSEYQGGSNSNGVLTYYEAHPEWFGLHKEKRSSTMVEWYGANYFTSNEDATEELGKNFIQSLIDGKMKYADIIYFWMLDAGSWCECEQCKQLGTPTDRMMLLTYNINKKVQQAIKESCLKRPIHLNTLAYQETVEPLTKPLPSDFDYNNCSVTFFPIKRCYAHTFADPCCKEINEYLCQNYKKWANEQSFYKGSIFVGEYFNISSFKSLPMVLPRIISSDIPWFYNNKARHFHYMHVLIDLWGTWTLNEHLLSKILWNPEIDTNSVIDNYFASYYPTTSETTRQFYTLLEKALSNAMAWKGGLNVYGKERYNIQHKCRDMQELFPYNHLQYANSDCNSLGIADMIEYINLARQKIDQALWEAKNPEEKKRLLEDELRFTYAEKTCLFYYRIIRATIFDRQGDESLAKNEFKHLASLAEELSNMKNVTNCSAKDASSTDAFKATAFTGHYNYLKEKYGK
jgi:hypothetical protein